MPRYSIPNDAADESPPTNRRAASDSTAPQHSTPIDAADESLQGLTPDVHHLGGVAEPGEWSRVQSANVWATIVDLDELEIVSEEAPELELTSELRPIDASEPIEESAATTSPRTAGAATDDQAAGRARLLEPRVEAEPEALKPAGPTSQRDGSRVTEPEVVPATPPLELERGLGAPLAPTGVGESPRSTTDAPAVSSPVTAPPTAEGDDLATATERARWSGLTGMSELRRTQVKIQHPSFGPLRLEVATESDGHELELITSSVVSALRLERDLERLRERLRRLANEKRVRLRVKLEAATNSSKRASFELENTQGPED